MDASAAGRAYAADGGVYVCVALAWLWIVEGVRADRADTLGGLVCLLEQRSLLGPPKAILEQTARPPGHHLPDGATSAVKPSIVGARETPFMCLRTAIADLDG